VSKISLRGAIKLGGSLDDILPAKARVERGL